jgi:hypothetical protein
MYLDIFEERYPSERYFTFRNLQKMQESWIRSMNSRVIPLDNIERSNDILSLITPQEFQAHKNEYTNNALAFLNNSKDFYNYSNTASLKNKPILEHYSAIMLSSFVMQSIVKFKKTVYKHGININSNISIGAEIKNNNISFRINKFGFFSRLVHFLTILGFPSIFSPFIIDIKEGKYIIKSRKGKFSLDKEIVITLNQFGNYEEEYRNNIIKKWIDESFNEINAIADFKPIIRTQGSTTHLLGIHQGSSRILTNFLLYNICSILARYYPRVWNEIIDGKDTGFINIYKCVSKDLNTFISTFSNLIIDNLETIKYEQDSQ